MAIVSMARPTLAPLLHERQAVVNGYTSVTYNNGMYTPVESTSPPAITQAEHISTFTADDSKTTTSSANTDASSTSSLTSTVSSIASSLTSSLKPSNTPKLDNTSPHKFHFKITYLIPIFVIVGLILVLVIAGRLWGRIIHSKERQRSKQQRNILRQQKREKQERVEKIRRQWEENGWGESLDPDVSLEKQHTDHGYDSDVSDEEQKGSLQGAGHHLAGVDYLQGNVETPMSEKAGSQSLRATLRGTWDRVKLKMTGNVGWGYNGSTPTISQRRQIIADASSAHLWSRIPVSSNDVPHTSGGLLLPPMIDDEGQPIMPAPQQSRRTLFPLARFGTPELKNPPNTIKVFPSSSSQTALAGVKNLFAAFRGRSSQSFGGGSTYKGRHERLKSEEQVADLHMHEHGSRCTLTGPQYLPLMIVQCDDETVQRYSLADDGPESLRSPEIITSPPPTTAVSVQRKTTQIQVKQIQNDSIFLTKKKEDDDDKYTIKPTSSILRHKSQRSLALSRSSTVRFMDTTDDSVIGTTLPSYSPGAPSEYSQMSYEVDERQDPLKGLSRASTIMGTKCADERHLRKSQSIGNEFTSSAIKIEATINTREKETRSIKKAGRHAKRSSSKKSSRSYTESVKFGDEDDAESQRSTKHLPKDSRFLARSKTIKKSLADLSSIERDEEESEGEIVMDLAQSYLEYEASPGSQLSSFYNAYYTEDEDRNPDRDVEDDINSALLSLMGTSRSSQNTLSLDLHEPTSASTALLTPVPSTPVARKKTWQERNGKWERLSEGEMQELIHHRDEEEKSPAKFLSYTASPPPLPAPPTAAAWKQVHSPAISSTFRSALLLLHPLANHGLHTGKSMRSPSDKARETLFAIERVQSIITKGHASRQQSC